MSPKKIQKSPEVQEGFTAEEKAAMKARPGNEGGRARE
jgi:hypothetical protein